MLRLSVFIGDPCEDERAHDSFCEPLFSAEYQPQAHPVATSNMYPALIPFLDFSTFDPDFNRSQMEAMTNNQKQLETHLLMVQEDYQKERDRCNALQNSVDDSLGRVLVWVKAVHNSLVDLSSNAVRQEVMALAEFGKSCGMVGCSHL